MYAVIFTATLAEPDQRYHDTALHLREMASERYGCRDFISCSENGMEVSISYWDSLDDIERWRNDPEHVKAQKLGKQRWYRSYRAQIARIEES